MIRILFHLSLLLVPFVVYGLYVWLLARSEQRGWNRTPWFWLATSGLVLVIGSLIVLGVVSGGPPGATYRPAETRDGKIVPGEIR